MQPGTHCLARRLKTSNLDLTLDIAELLLSTPIHVDEWKKFTRVEAKFRRIRNKR